jgi:hypothetical protein
MKPFIKTPLTAILLSFFALSACNKSSTDNVSPSNNNTSPSSAFISGNWAITSYTQRTENKTNQFAGAVFTFNENGGVSVVMNGTTSTGTWAYYPSTVGYYGGTPSVASMSLSFGTSALSRLNRTWNITSSSSTSVLLVNPEPADDEHITFTKQ